MAVFAKELRHTAFDDIRESLAEARAVKEFTFPAAPRTSTR